MTTSSKSFWPIVAAVGLGVGFVGYCIYFDQKRRNAPEFREKLKAKRKKQKQHTSHSNEDFTIDSSNPEEMRRYFLEQIQRGEDCLSRGDLDNGVDHLAKAVAVCSQPQSLMSLFQQTLPPELFQEIIMRLPRVAQSVHGASSSSFGGGAIITEPDLE
ncbi:unnamed protein product [Adineta steineri]|uniref:Mitochondrial import receptor subunit TOM20-like protein n=2 Tax=Adineta steineri TaxID=433720 RepID=A0A818X643_9BILA|nr:unnamed protein product [Adineta steineri]CAF1276047.1 unnamed protein product [Adineta steineri]CAF1329579.1 unnamed protein product [Adineta steineri]CAF1329773.1 unnamed protein product [Adineta steineri]CAF1368191.1 unnamed protein product [Adineta steineri]